MLISLLVSPQTLWKIVAGFLWLVTHVPGGRCFTPNPFPPAQRRAAEAEGAWCGVEGAGGKWGQQEAQREIPNECLSPEERSPAPAGPKTPLILPKTQQNSFPWWRGLPFRSRQSILGARSLNSCKRQSRSLARGRKGGGFQHQNEEITQKIGQIPTPKRAKSLHFVPEV